MLKRLSSSFTKDAQQAHDLAFLSPPTPGFRTPGLTSPRSSPKRASFPFDNASSHPFPIAPAPPAAQSAVSPAGTVGRRSIERTVLHKTLTNLSSLLVALDELRDTSQAHSKARKHVAKATRDLADGFKEKSAGVGGRSDEVAEALVSCATMLEALYEVEEKHAKSLRKEYEALNDTIARYFRKTAKEEKAHEDRLADLDARVAKATASYQSTARTASASSQRNMHAALDSMTTQHSSYMHELSALSTQINHAKAAYAGEVAGRREVATREVASALCATTEREWRQDVEAVRRGADSIGRLVSAAVWVAPGMDRVTVAAPQEPSVAPSTADRHSAAHAQTSPYLSESPALPQPSRDPSSTVETVKSASTANSASVARRPSIYTVSHISGSTSTSSNSRNSQSRAPSTPLVRPVSAPRSDSPHQQGHFARMEPPFLPLAPTHLGPAATSVLSSSEHLPRAQPVAASLRNFTTSEVPLPQAREIGQTAAEQVLDRQDSFVAKMSRKYSEPVAGQEWQPVLEGSITSRHVRSDSRVSQLAKRYSLPSNAAEPQFPARPVPTTPHRLQATPRWVGPIDAVQADLRDSSNPQPRPAYPDADTPLRTAASPRSSTPGSARIRAYQMAQTLPR